jgi:hypothetical protein
VEPASNAKATIAWVNRILAEERDIVISSRPLEATAFQVENIRIAYVFYESGLSINVMYTIDDPGKRAVGFKLSEGMEVPEELSSKFKVREPEVEAGWNDSRFLLRRQERMLTAHRLCQAPSPLCRIKAAIDKQAIVAANVMLAVNGLVRVESTPMPMTGGEFPTKQAM